MKKCPNCNMELSDDSRFCTSCGQQLPHDNSFCPQCGAAIKEGDAFCQNCGKNISQSLSSAPIINEERKKIGIKNFLPYIIGAIILLMIVGYYSSNESSNSNAVTQTTDSVIVNNSEDNPEQEIQAKINFLEKFYKEKNFEEQALEYAYIKKNVTVNGLKNLKELYDYDCDGECLATWVFDYDSGSDIGELKSRAITHKDANCFLVENKYEYADYNVLLTVVKEGDVYKIDKIEPIESSYANQEEQIQEEQDDTENLDWLQGHWVYEQGSYKGHFLIQGNTITQFSSMNPEHDVATFRIEGNELRAKVIDGMDLVVKIDFANKRIDYGDNNWMHKVE